MPTLGTGFMPTSAVLVLAQRRLSLGLLLALAYLYSLAKVAYVRLLVLFAKLIRKA